MESAKECFDRWRLLSENDFRDLFRGNIHGIIKDINKKDSRVNGFVFLNEKYEFLTFLNLEELEPLEKINYETPLLDLPEAWKGLYITVPNVVRWKIIAERQPDGNVQLMGVSY